MVKINMCEHTHAHIYTHGTHTCIHVHTQNILHVHIFIHSTYMCTYIHIEHTHAYISTHRIYML